MGLYHKWNVKNGFAYVLQFFSLISDGLGGVCNMAQTVCVLVGSSSAHEYKILKLLCKSTLKLQQLNYDFYTIKYFQICNVN